MKDSPFLSVRFVNVILETLEDLGVEQALVLENTNITQELLAKDHYIFPFSSIQQIFINGVIHSGMSPEELGFRCGKRGNINAYGPPGMAALSENNFGKALDIAQKYISIVLPSFDIVREDTDTHVILRLKENIAMSEIAKRICLCSFIGSCQSMIQTLVGNADSIDRTDVSIILPFEELHFLTNDKDLSKNNLVFNADEPRFIFPKLGLHLPMPLANKFVAKQSLEECEKLKSKNRVHLVTHIRNELMVSEYDFPSLEDFAWRFNVSSRTLHRLLSDEGYSFRSLLREVKMVRAKQLFKKSQISVTEVADILGYADTANFTKAFKTTYGETPKSYLHSVRR